MSPKENDPKYVKSQGSAPKAQATVKQTLVLDRDVWKVGSIAWNEAGDVVILDPKLAEHVSKQAQVDKALEIGIPPVEVRVGKATDGGAGMPNPDCPVTGGEGKIPIPKPLELCACGKLFFNLVKINEPAVENLPAGPI